MGNDLPFVDLPDTFITAKIVAGYNFNCVLGTIPITSLSLNNSNSIVCWGQNSHYQLGSGTTSSVGNGPEEMGNHLTLVDLGTDFVPIDIEAGGEHVCSMSERKEVKCWGMNTYGQLGIGCGWTQEFGDNLPILDFGTNFIPQQMALGGYHSCFVSTFGEMKCTGSNGNGQLGYGDSAGRGVCGTPYESLANMAIVDVGANFNITQIQTGQNLNCVLNDREEMKCFGSNAYGQLGLGDFSNRGDVSSEMGDHLEFVNIPLTANPTSEPTTIPSIDPTIFPTENPVIEATKASLSPTIDPIILSTKSIVIEASVESVSPTIDPTIFPTKSPVIEVSVESLSPTLATTVSTVAEKLNDGESELLLNLVMTISFVLFLTCCGLVLCAMYVWRNKKESSIVSKQQMEASEGKHAIVISSLEHDVELVSGQAGRSNDSIYGEGEEGRTFVKRKEESISDDMFGHNDSDNDKSGISGYRSDINATTTKDGLTLQQRADV